MHLDSPVLSLRIDPGCPHKIEIVSTVAREERCYNYKIIDFFGSRWDFI